MQHKTNQAEPFAPPNLSPSGGSRCNTAITVPNPFARTTKQRRTVSAAATMKAVRHSSQFVAASSSAEPQTLFHHVMRYMETHFTERLLLAELARMCSLSTFRFATVFRQRVGIPPHQYLCHLRVLHAQNLLRRGMPPIVAALESGFFDQSHFSRHFKRICGTTPGRYVASSY